MSKETPSPIALLTDFGTQDAYVGTMKGVILRHCPTIPLVDLTHEIAPQNVRQAAFVLWTAYRYFPDSSVFLVVVDPGVGSSRHAVAVKTEHGCFVGPDNGVFSEVLAEAEDWQAVILDPAVVAPDRPSATFHGRDLFAPAAARLACGADIATLGKPLADLVKLEPARLSLTHTTIEGEVIYIDHFGNVVTSIGRCYWREDGLLALIPRLVPDATPILFSPSTTIVYAGRHQFTGIARTYAHVPAGQATPLINSAGQLEIAVNQGSAHQNLGLTVGEHVVLRLGTLIDTKPSAGTT